MATSPTLQVTTVDRIKKLSANSLNAPEHDDLITSYIDEVSTQVELYLCPLLNATVTEYRDLCQFQREIWLDRWPVTSITSVYNRSSVSVAWADANEIESTNFDFSASSARLILDATVQPGGRALRVIYVAGFATTTAALLTAYPDIVGAAERQIIHMYRRRTHPEKTSVSEGGMTQTTVQVELLRSVKQTLDRHRRIIV